MIKLKTFVLLLLVMLFVFSGCSLGGQTGRVLLDDKENVSIPLSFYDSYKGKSTDEIYRYVVSSSKWYFTKDTYKDKTWISAEYYEAKDKNTLQITIFFSDVWPVRNWGQKLDAHGLVNTPSVNVDLYGWKTSDGVLEKEFVSNLVLKFSDSFYIIIKESSTSKERKLTQKAFDEYIGELFLTENEQYNLLVEDGSIQKMQEPSLNVGVDIYGVHEISGYIHTDKKNISWIRVTDATGEEVYYDQSIKGQTSAVGWSSSEEEFFCFYQKIPIGRPKEELASATVIVEIWIEEENEVAYCAISTTVFMKFWRR